MNAGIDYGSGVTNIDHATGIRYGVINQNRCLQAWADSSEPDYGMPHCPHCFAQVDKKIADMDETECPQCHEIVHEVYEWYPEDPVGYSLQDGEYDAYCGESGDIFITKSPYYTLCRFCSPCAPGAGDLSAPTDGGVQAFCFGPDFFEDDEDDKPPYPVYEVATGKLIHPGVKEE
jgi:hypothetical protein